MSTAVKLGSIADGLAQRKLTSLVERELLQIRGAWYKVVGFDDETGDVALKLLYRGRQSRAPYRVIQQRLAYSDVWTPAVIDEREHVIVEVKGTTEEIREENAKAVVWGLENYPRASLPANPPTRWERLLTKVFGR